MNFPKDPFILLSVVNTKLRDCYSSFDELCEDLQADSEQIIRTLAQAGFEYNEELNKFV